MLSRRAVLQTLQLTPMLAGGASDRLEEGLFRLRHRTGTLAPSEGDLKHDLGESIVAGLGFLEHTQRSNGLWRGFMLAPGASTDWVSAHIALLLEDVPQSRSMRERVALGLLESGRRRGGWGYNRRVSVDSDSTAQAMMVLHGLGHEVSPTWVERLLAARREEGGFATFVTTRADGQARTWWETAHPDVTLIVIETFERLSCCSEVRSQAREWLLGRSADGVLPAYWWTSPAYSLWAQARAGFEPTSTSRLAAEMVPSEQRAVYLAMLIVAALSHGGSPTQLLEAASRLMQARLQDGSWPCAPCLRTTRASHAGGFEAPGSIHADRYRAFSTAHAVAALSLTLKALDASAVGAAPAL